MTQPTVSKQQKKPVGRWDQASVQPWPLHHVTEELRHRKPEQTQGYQSVHGIKQCWQVLIGNIVNFVYLHSLAQPCRQHMLALHQTCITSGQSNLVTAASNPFPFPLQWEIRAPIHTMILGPKRLHSKQDFDLISHFCMAQRHLQTDW